MRRWIELQGYMLVYRLATSESRTGRWLHDRWAGFWFKRYCPHPILAHTNSARACVAAGDCGCENAKFYPPARS